MHVATFYCGGAFEHELFEAGVPVHCLEKHRPLNVIGPYVRLRRLIRDIEPGVVHGILPLPNLLLTAAAKNAHTVWGICIAGMMDQPLKLRERFLYWLERRLAGRADAVIAYSRAGEKEMLACGAPRDRLVTIPNGFDHERFCPDPQAGTAVRQSLGISEDAAVFGVIGRHDRHKNHQLALRAFAELCCPQARLLMIGRPAGSQTTRLHALETDLGISDRVLWVGEREDMPAVYNAMDVLVSVSLAEGHPNVVGEAMLSGVPCVVSDVGDCANMVGDLGEVVGFEAPEVSLGMSRMLERLANGGLAYRRALRASMRERFSTERLVDGVMSVLYEFPG